MKKLLLLMGTIMSFSWQHAWAQDTEPEPATQTEKPRVLGTVNVTRSRGAPAPTTGRLIMAVDVIAKNRRIRTAAGVRARRESRAASTINSYRLSMRAVDFPADGGKPYLKPLESGPRNFDYIGDDSEDQFVAFDLAPGYYILSNISFEVSTLDSSDIDPFTGDFSDATSSPSLSSSFRTSLNTVNYCINEKTVVFEIVEGQTSYFGYLQLSEPPANRPRQSDHVPIVGFDQSLEIFQARSKWDDRTDTEIVKTPIKAIPFDTTGETCQVASAHRVKGWESSES